MTKPTLTPLNFWMMHDSGPSCDGVEGEDASCSFSAADAPEMGREGQTVLKKSPVDGNRVEYLYEAWPSTTVEHERRGDHHSRTRKPLGSDVDLLMNAIVTYMESEVDFI